MLETVVVVVLVAAAGAMVVRSAYRVITGKQAGCSCESVCPGKTGSCSSGAAKGSARSDAAAEKKTEAGEGSGEVG